MKNEISSALGVYFLKNKNPALKPLCNAGSPIQRLASWLKMDFERLENIIEGNIIPNDEELEKIFRFLDFTPNQIEDFKTNAANMRKEQV